MAKNTVDMMYGTYQWPDGRAHTDETGAPKVEKFELMRSVGYAVTYKERGRALFEDDYYKEQVALEMARREQAFAAVTKPIEMNVMNLGALMLTEAWVRITTDPGSFSSEQLCKYGAALYKVGAELEARAKAAERPRKDHDRVRDVFAQNVVFMNEEGRRELAEGLDEVRAERSERLQRLITAATAREKEAEVIDAEVAPE